MPTPTPTAMPMPMAEVASRKVGATCPVTHTLDLLRGKWTLLVVRELIAGTQRFTQIQRGLNGVNPRTLAERLKMLEDDGIVTRRAYAEVPPRVEYTLTERGLSLAPVLEAMADWGTADLAGLP